MRGGEPAKSVKAKRGSEVRRQEVAEAPDAFFVVTQVRGGPALVGIFHPQSRTRVKPGQRILVAEAEQVANQALAVEPEAGLRPIGGDAVLRSGPPDALECHRVIAFPETQEQAANEVLQRVVCGRTVGENRFPNRARYPFGRRDRQDSELQEDVVAEVLARQVLLAVLLLFARLGARGVVVPDAQRQARVEFAVASAIAIDEPVEQDFKEVTV